MFLSFFKNVYPSFQNNALEENVSTTNIINEKGCLLLFECLSVKDADFLPTGTRVKMKYL